MRRVTADAATLEFDDILDAVQHDPIEITRDGQAVAVMVSPEALRRLIGHKAGAPRAEIDRLMRESLARHGRVYEALAKWEAAHDRGDAEGR